MAIRAEQTLKIFEQGVQPLDSGALGVLLEDARWDDLATFAAAAQTCSLRRAAAARGVSVNTVRARVERLERCVGVTLLSRTSGGTSATAAGRSVAAAIAAMRDAAALTGGDVREEVLKRPGELVIGCSEGLASLWLTPRLAALRTSVPHLTISLQSDYDLARDRSAELDVGIAFTRPADPSVIVSRLATIHLMLFASDAYLREHGVPASIDDFRNHRFIEQAAPGLNPSLLDFFIGRDRPTGFVPIRSNSSLSVFWAAANGAGIAALPTYVRAISRRVVPLDLPLRLRFDLYYYYHASAKRSPAVRAVVDWLKQSFDPQANPWFAEQFVHPNAFADESRSARVVSLFSTLADPAGQSACD